MRLSALASSLATLALSAALLPCPALAEYCGPASDTQAVEALTASRALHDPTRIMYLSVIGPFAISDLEWKGEQIMYFVKRCGTWAVSGNFPPADLPPDSKQHFDAIIDTIPHPCSNPHFVNHPSGP
jgi:hypothetical protein